VYHSITCLRLDTAASASLRLGGRRPGGSTNVLTSGRKAAMNDDTRSPKQRAVDHLAELLEEAFQRILNQVRHHDESDDDFIWRRVEETDLWIDRVNDALKDRRFFSLANHLHFEVLGLVERKEYRDLEDLTSSGIEANPDYELIKSHLGARFERLRDIIRWNHPNRNAPDDERERS
jgi:hypothetical protein